MKEGWRWYGDLDRISLGEIAQTGARSIVTALHDIPYGEVWPRDRIAARATEIREAGFEWTVVESLPIHENIKKNSGDLSDYFANYRQSMANLAAEGVKVICYNFMPLLDWTRTDLQAPVAHGGTCLRFDITRMAVLDVFMLERPGAAEDFAPEIIEKARTWFDGSSEDDRAALVHAVMSGLPGAYDRYDINSLKEALKGYEGIDRTTLRSNYKRFLEEIIPAAEDLGLTFGVHPDDPPRDLLGLPRIVSCVEDIRWILNAVDSPANGLTLCSGSLGANPANDVPEIAREFSGKIHFAHMRNVAKEADGSFEEAPHLSGNTDMIALAKVLHEESAERQKKGGEAIVFRPDHGHELLDDIGRGTHPGYPLIGRMRGLAELRGILKTLDHANARVPEIA